MNCDICSNNLKASDYYILTTSQVTYSQPYWKFCLEHLERIRPGYTQKHPLKFLEVVLRFCGAKSDWAVCPNCIRYFDVDRNNAKKWAKDVERTGRHAPIPGSGEADALVGFLGASIAWKEMYGSNLVKLLKASASDVGKEVDNSSRIFSAEPGTKREAIRRVLKLFDQMG